MQNIYATFTTVEMMEKVGGALIDHGLKPEQISMVLSRSFAAGEDATKSHDATEKKVTAGITTTTPADAAAGSMTGAGIGFAAGTIAALAAVFLPGIGLVLGGGALAIAIGGVAGTTAAGAVAGGVTGYLKDQGVPAEYLEEYSRALEGGGGFVTITCDTDAAHMAEIEALLVKYGGSVRAYPFPLNAPGTMVREDEERVPLVR